MIEIVRNDAIKQRSNLMLILYERKLAVESLSISKQKNGLLFQKKMIM